MSRDPEDVKRRLERRLLRQKLECEALLPRVSEIDAIIQVGLGNWWEGPHLLKRFPSARYYGIEVVQRYCESAKQNGFPGLIIHGAAWDKTGEIFTLGERRDRTDMFTKPVRRPFQIQTFTLDDAFKETGRIFMWLDCEGSELKALLGAKELIKNTRVIQVEVKRNPGRGATENEVVRFIKANGFSRVTHYKALSLFQRKP